MICCCEHIQVPYGVFLNTLLYFFQALSKEHAVIEVVDENSHLIYDLGSRNKTRIGKVNLYLLRKL
jgi:hypothetical protein